MIRRAFYMEAKPGCAAAYEAVHNPIPAELAAALKSCGVRNYSIFLHEATNTLFGYLEAENDAELARLADYECCRNWWLAMREHLVCARPEDVKAKEEPMREVFHLD